MKISWYFRWMKKGVKQVMPENVELKCLGDDVLETSLTNLLRYEPLVASILDANWNDAHQFLSNDGGALTAKLNKGGDTVLHIAVETNKSNYFIRQLIEMMPIKALFNVDEDGKTAFLLAVEKNNTEVVELLLTKQPELPYIRCKRGRSPLQIAAEIGNRRMVSALLLATKDHTRHSPYGGEDGQNLLETLLWKNLYGAVTELLHRHPKLAVTELLHRHPKLRGEKNQNSISFLNNLIERQQLPFFSTHSFSLMERLLFFSIPTSQVHRFQFDEEVIKNQTKDPTNNEDGKSLTIKVQRVSLGVYIKVWIAIARKVPLDLYIKLWLAIGKRVPDLEFKQKQEMKFMHQEAVKFVEWTCMQFTREDYKEVEKTFKGPLKLAAKHGIEEIVQQILDLFPISIDDERSEILNSVVSKRHAYILKLKNHRSYFKQMATDYKDNEDNNILHLVAKSERDHTNHGKWSLFYLIFCKLHWFMEMEKLLPPSYRIMKNKKGETAEMIFIEKHEELLKEGERHLKVIATYCIVGSTFTAACAYAAALYLRVNITMEDSYIYRGMDVMLFSFADALSIILSNFSLFMFLVILMSRYTYRDFHRTLPQRLIMALASLILSILSIIVASIVIM